MGEKKVDTSNKLSYQFPYSLQKIFINLGAKYNYSTAAVFFSLLHYYSIKPRARCSFWQGTEVQVYTAIESNY